ncbi:unnamed protein product, partial [Choristocarpus tenellus]
QHGGAAAAHLAEDGQRYKAKVARLNRCAARMTFRLRNPGILVGPGIVQETSGDGESVLEILALPSPSKCPRAGQLEIDLHYLRLSEAISILESVLEALKGGVG